MAKRNICFLVVFVIFVFHAVNNYLILLKDNIPLLYDELNYFFESKRLYHLLCDIMSKGDLSWRFDILKHWNSPYPQLVQLTTAFFYYIFGVSEDVAVLSILPYLFILFLSVYLIGSKLYGKAAGLFAAFLISVFPMIFGMSRVYYLEVPVAAMTSIALLFIIYSDYFLSRRYSILFGVFFALALLVKWISIIFIVGPLAYCAFFAIYSKNKPKEFEKRVVANLFISLLVTLALISPVYALIAKVFLVKYGSIFINLYRKKTCDFSAYALTKYIMYLFKYQLFPLFSWFFFISLPFFYFCVRKGRLLLTFWIIPPYLFFTTLVICGYPECMRFSVPCLPAIALIISASIFKIKYFKRAFARTAFLLLLIIIILFGVMQFYKLSYDSEFKSPLASYIASCPQHGIGRYWSRYENWKGEELLTMILKQKSLLGASGLRVLPLHNLDVISSPIKKELYGYNNERNMEYDSFLGVVSGGYSCVEDKDYYENKIKLADMVIIKDGDLLCIDKCTCAPKVYQILMEMFEKHKDQFYLLATLDLPDKSHLLVYQKMR